LLKRISTLENIGTFKKCNGRQSQFDKITLIYGRNTYGKSTLGDIFSSLKNSDVNLLTARKSIPVDGQGQKIEFNFSDADGKKEIKTIFKNGSWMNALPTHLSLAVYDDGFYHQNVFLGRKLTRDTKENFSDFILGEQGVVKAEEISEKNKILSTKKADLKKLIKNEFTKVEKIDEFIALAVVDDIESTRKRLDDKREEYALLNSQKRASKGILSRKNLFPLRVEPHFKEAVTAINNVLIIGLENPHEAAKAELNRHIEEHFVKPEGAEQWIRQGLSLLNSDNCHFCGQELSPQADELLDLYRQCFDDQFARHEGHVKSTIDQHQPLLTRHWLDKLSSSIENAALTLQSYPELSNENEIPETISQITTIHNVLTEQVTLLKVQVSLVIEELTPLISKKLLDPKKVCLMVNTDGLNQLLDIVNSNVAELSVLYSAFNKRAHAFKAQFENDQVSQDLDRLKAEGLDIASKVERFEKDVACKEHQIFAMEIKKLEAEVPKLKEDLGNEQGTYLKTYFSRINRYFKELGSRDFVLEYKSEPRGNKPIYSFKVKFKKTEIAEQDMDKIFSESDRRSLGLSIFLASLDSLKPEELAKTIAVFDDPVTSFDENRVSQTHSKLIDLAKKCQQVILLSHFKDGVANFLKVHGFSRSDIALIEIYKNAEGSSLKVGDQDAFVKSAHHLNTEELIDFVERHTDKLSCKPRIYLEEVLSLRFSKQIREKKITNDTLSKRIDALKDEAIISQNIANVLHDWRSELNPEHHIWVNDDVENQRNTVASFLDFVFYELVPAPLGEV
jgi:wobble nucleotide-excising tRNase